MNSFKTEIRQIQLTLMYVPLYIKLIKYVQIKQLAQIQFSHHLYVR